MRPTAEQPTYVVEVAEARREAEQDDAQATLEDDDGMWWQVRPHVRGHASRALHVASHTTARVVRDATCVPAPPSSPARSELFGVC
jgi:gamma-glutamyl:cysteine ligase YbdK (ATP-grasp superfamily)